MHSILLQRPACSLRPGRLLIHWQGTGALAHLRTGDPSQMEEAAPKGVHALSFASLAHKSFIKDVSFAYTEGRQMPLRTRMKYRYKRLLQAPLGLCVCLLVWEGATSLLLQFAQLFLILIWCVHALIMCYSIFTMLMVLTIQMQMS